MVENESSVGKDLGRSEKIISDWIDRSTDEMGINWHRVLRFIDEDRETIGNLTPEEESRVESFITNAALQADLDDSPLVGAVREAVALWESEQKGRST